MLPGALQSFGAGGTDVWLIRLEPESLGVAETMNDERGTMNSGATVLRRLPAGAVVFNAIERRAANPKPGVYFVRMKGQRDQGIERSSVRKVVVTR